MKLIGFATIACLAAGAAAVIAALRTPGVKLEVLDLKPASAAHREEPGMCPWRDPERDLHAFFPGAGGYRTELVSLSAHRTEILSRLGPGGKIESHSLYVHRALTPSCGLAGTVLVRRAHGPHGAIEVVAAVEPGGRLKAVRIQRQREPPAVASAITDARWLAAFRGKDVRSAFRPGGDLPAVPAGAESAEAAVADSVRQLMVELDAGDRKPDEWKGRAPAVHDHAAKPPVTP